MFSGCLFLSARALSGNYALSLKLECIQMSQEEEPFLEEEESIEPYLNLLSTTRERIDAQTDIAVIKSVELHIGQIAAKRNRILADISDRNESLRSHISMAKNAILSLRNSDERKELEKKQRDLDYQKLHVVKKLNDLEAEHAQKLGQLQKSRLELAELESTNLLDEIAPMVDEKVLLKLKIYRSLGISFNKTKSKVICTNQSNGRITTVNLDRGYTPQFTRQLMWDAL